MKNMKTSLVLAATLILGGFTSVSAKDEWARPVFETLARSSGAQLDIKLPQPALRAKGQQNPSDDALGGNANCVPSAAIAPGAGFSPAINDAVRSPAIAELLAKISACKPLPFSQDGVTNNNLEGGMPPAPKGHYKEYTLIVPGRQTGDGPEPINIGGQIYMSGAMQSKRGPERIIIGGGKSIYFTPDHYKTFIELKIVR